MSGKCRPSLRAKTLENVKRCNLSETDKDCIKAVFEEFERLKENEKTVIREFRVVNADKERILLIAAELSRKLKTAKAEAVKEFAEKTPMYFVQFGLDTIKMFVKKKTKLDPVGATNITIEELEDMHQEAQRFTDYLLKEMVGEG